MEEVKLGEELSPSMLQCVEDIKPELDDRLSMLLEQGAPLIYSAYMLYEDAKAEEIIFQGGNIACQKGYSSCCAQTFILTELEFQYLMEGYEALDQKTRYWVNKRMKKYLSEYKRIVKNNIPALATSFLMYGTSDMYMLEIMASMHGRNCPFLDEGVCAIYSHRPLECRTCFSPDKEDCTTGNASISYFTTAFEIWLQRTVRKFQQDKEGRTEVRLLPERLLEIKLS